METSTLFPRRLEKHKFLLRSIEGVAFLTRDIGNYPCLTEASTADHYSTTCLQYSVVKIFKNLYKLVVRRSKHCVTTSPTIFNFYLNTFSTQIPMKCGRRNMIRVLNYFPECVKLLSILFHLNIHRHVKNAILNRTTV